MTDPTEERLSDTRAALRSVLDYVEEAEDRTGVSLTAAFLQKRADRLTQRMAGGNPVFCDYRITSAAGQPAVGPLADALKAFQSLFSITYDALTHGPKQRMRVADDVAALTQLHLARAYEGSVGTILTLPADSQGHLFASPRLEETARTLGDLTTVTTRQQLTATSGRLGAAVIRALLRWSEAHAKGGLGADLSWFGGGRSVARRTISAERFGELYEYVNSESEVRETRLSLIADLVGIDVDKDTFHAETLEGADLRGVIGAAADLPRPIPIPSLCRITIVRRTVVQYAQERDQTRNVLVGLSLIKGGDRAGEEPTRE